MSFAEKLIAIRTQKNLSQNQLAMKSGISQTAISAIERENRKPLESTIIILSEALGVDPRDMIDDTKDPAVISGMDRELVNLLSDLRPEEILRVRDFVAGIKASRAASSSPKK